MPIATGLPAHRVAMHPDEVVLPTPPLPLTKTKRRSGLSKILLSPQAASEDTFVTVALVTTPLRATPRAIASLTLTPLAYLPLLQQVALRDRQTPCNFVDPHTKLIFPVPVISNNSTKPHARTPGAPSSYPSAPPTIAMSTNPSSLTSLASLMCPLQV